MNIKEGLIQRRINDRQRLQRMETEEFLLAEIEKYPERAEKLWQRDYSSIEKFLSFPDWVCYFSPVRRKI